MTAELGELIAGTAPLLASHLALVLVALAIAVVVGVPLAVVLTRRPRLAAAMIGVAGAVQTVPSLALLALMVPVLATTGGLGVGLSPFGFAPAVIALAIYALLPIVRNTIAGLRGVDAAAVEAARGLGMTPRQLLAVVELPLAAPVIAAGIRTASVWTVGTATLATPIGQACLGNYIFAGLQTRNWAMLLIGVIAAAALALVLDAILAGAERAMTRRPRGSLAVPAAGLVALAVLGLAVLPHVVTQRTAISGAPPPARMPPGAGDGARITRVRIGAKTFTEQYILAELLRQRLAGRGIAAELVESLGSHVVFDAVRGGTLDAYVDYAGTLWTTQLGRDRGAPRWQILAEVEGHLASVQVRSLGPLGFQNAYALAVRRDTAARLGLHSLGDLAPHAAELALGADYEFLSRREWTSVRTTYGLGFARAASFDPALLYEAIARREVDVISAFSSDGRIAAYDLVVLDDPAAALPSYDAMILLGPRVAEDAGVVCALAPLRGALPVGLMQRANLRVDHDHATPRDAAAWLLGQVTITEICDQSPAP